MNLAIERAQNFSCGLRLRRRRGEPTCLPPMLLFVEAVRAVTSSAAGRYLVGVVADGGEVVASFDVHGDTFDVRMHPTSPHSIEQDIRAGFDEAAARSAATRGAAAELWLEAAGDGRESQTTCISAACRAEHQRLELEAASQEMLFRAGGGDAGRIGAHRS